MGKCRRIARSRRAVHACSWWGHTVLKLATVNEIPRGRTDTADSQTPTTNGSFRRRCELSKSSRRKERGSYRRREVRANGCGGCTLWKNFGYTSPRTSRVNQVVMCMTWASFVLVSGVDSRVKPSEKVTQAKLVETSEK